MDVVCSLCRSRREYDPFVWRCTCGGPFDLDWCGRIDVDELHASAPTLWRYRSALPLPPDAEPISLGEPVTPVVEFRDAGVDILLKLDFLTPTGSYKDRGSAVLMTDLASRGVRAVVEDSSGNAGASIAAYAARAGIHATIYTPVSTSPGKTAQIEAYGAELKRINGDRAATAAAVRKDAEHTCYASHVWNPLFHHGVKTAAYEIAEQLNWRTPAAVVVPAGNGSLLLGLALGFDELVRQRLVRTAPPLIAVQADACRPLVDAWNGEAPTAIGRTVAEGIAISRPPRSDAILSAVRHSGGCCISVSEERIAEAARLLASRGLLVEPTAAVALAGSIECGAPVGSVVFLTGSGMKSLHRL